MKTPLQLDILPTSVLIFLISTTQNYVNSHGALKFPASRQWICSGGALPNLGVGVNGMGGAKVCRAQSHRDFALNHNINKLIRDWSGVAQLPGGYSSRSTYPNYMVVFLECLVYYGHFEGVLAHSGIKTPVF